MQRWFILALIALTLSGCASGRQTTGEAPADAPSSKLSVDLKVTSEPPGAQVEVLEPNDPQGTAYRKSGKQGVTPCQFTLEQNQPMKYFLEIKKAGYKTEKHDICLYENQGEGGQKAGNVIDKAGDLLFSPALWVVAWAVKKIPGSKYLTADPNPVTVTLASEAAFPSKPSAPSASPVIPPKSQTSQAVDLSCLFKSLSLSTAQEITGSGGPPVAKVVPLGTYAKLQDPSREFSCQALREELEKGGKLAFFKGVLEMGNQVYHFQDGAFLVAKGPGKFLGCGITCRPLARAEEPVKEEVSPRGRKTQKPSDEDEED